MQNHLRNELHNVLSGKSEVRFGTIVQTIASYLSDGAQTSSNAENQKHHDEQEATRLEKFIFENNLWVTIFRFFSICK